MRLRWPRWLFWTAILCWLVGCGSIGQIVQAEPDTRFVDEPVSIYFSDTRGTHQIDLDGSGRGDVWPAGFRLEDVHPGGPYALTDSDTNLFVSHGPGDLREVPELHGRASAVRFDNAGTKLMASRHADYSRPQTEWVEDDALYLVDVDTLDVRIFPAQSGEWVTSLGWNDAGTEVWTESQNGVTQWVNLATGARRPRDPNDRPNARGVPTVALPDQCAQQGLGLASDDHGIYLLRDGAKEQIVVLEGRKRGYEDFEPTFESLFFSPSCRHVIFTYAGGIWVAQVSSHRVGELTKGWDPMPVP